MILKLTPQATHPEIEQLLQRLRVMGFQAVKESRGGRMCIAIVNGIDAQTNMAAFSNLPHVESVETFSQQFKLAGCDVSKTRSVIDIRGRKIGGSELAVMAGPCSIESAEQIDRIAEAVKAAGAQFLRGGAFKPRTSPYDFQGLGEEGCRHLQAAARRHDLISVSEVMDEHQLEQAAPLVDILQIGTRNMQNFSLLKALGKVQNPVVLKRGFAATYKDLLMAAEYILSAGNPNVILCERGIRTFENYTRNTLDLAAVPALKALSHLPVMIDPSHGTGIRSMIAPMSKAAVACGADALIIEVHYDPDNSYSDAQQTISTEQFARLMTSLKKLKQAL